jgi:hypothetical protein
MKILQNSIKCLKCQEEIISYHRHDFKWCSCKSVYCDGGLSCPRRGGELSNFVDTSIYSNGTFEMERKYFRLYDFDAKEYNYITNIATETLWNTVTVPNLAKGLVDFISEELIYRENE